MEHSELIFWFINCKGVMEDIALLKRQTKDYEIILSHINNYDMEKLLHCENVRLRMDGYKFERSKYALIDIMNFDVIDSLYSDYKDYIDLLFYY